MPPEVTDVVRVLCVEDLRLVAEAISDDVSREPGFQCVGILQTPDGLVDQVRRLHVDVVLLDLRTGGADAFHALSVLSSTLPEVRVIVVSGDNHPQTIQQAFDAGARGYVVKRDPKEIIEALKVVAAGETWAPRHPLIR